MHAQYRNNRWAMGRQLNMLYLVCQGGAFWPEVAIRNHLLAQAAVRFVHPVVPTQVLQT